MMKNLLPLLRGEVSQMDIAKKYKVTQQAWSSWENGRTLPELSIMFELQEDFGIPLEVIFFNNSDYKMKSNRA